MSMLDQTNEWTDQSLRYISAALNSEHNNKKGVEIGEILKKMLPDNFSPKRILDVGCGTGDHVNKLYNNSQTRPLISHIKNKIDLKEFISKHLFERSLFYEKATIKISVDNKSIPEIIGEILLSLD